MPDSIDPLDLVVVLGMHRSGTSAITRGLQVIGVDLGANLMPPANHINEKGFFEDCDIVNINISLLNHLCLDWHHVTPLTDLQVEDLCVSGYLLKAADLIREKIAIKRPYGIKDPRLSKLMPFWKKVFEHCQINVGFVIAIRNPISVAKSLNGRDGFSFEQCYLLWLEHTLAAVVHTKGLSRVVLDFDLVLENPFKQIHRVADTFGLSLNPIALSEYTSQFLDRQLRHSIYEPQDLASDLRISPMIRELYLTLRTAASMDEPLTISEDKLARFEHGSNNLYPWIVYIDRLHQSIAERDAQAKALIMDFEAHENQLATLSQAASEQDARVLALIQEVTERETQVALLEEQIMNLNDLVELIKKWQKLPRIKKLVKPLRLSPQHPQKIHPLRKLERSIRKRRVAVYEWMRFDRTWYLKNYPDVCEAGVDPWKHYIDYGRREGRAPNGKKNNSEHKLLPLDCLRIALRSPGKALKLSRIKKQIKKGNYVDVPFDIRLLWATGVRSFWKRNLKIYEINKILKKYSKQTSLNSDIETRIAEEILGGVKNKFFNLSIDEIPLTSWNRNSLVIKASPGLPSSEQWDSVRRKRNNIPRIDIIIPVYGQKNETLSCIYSVLNSNCITAFELIVVDDGCKDEELGQYLAMLAQRRLITLVTNKVNLGFVKSVNVGMELHKDRDVILLNSDTVVYLDWIDRIVAHAADDSVATITPLSNSATICSYPMFCRDYDYSYDIPDEEIDRLASTIDIDPVEVPTGVGFCMFVRRACLDAVGCFDADKFGRGYGEENDFCQRAMRRGWKNIAIGNVFVRHFGGSSFGALKADLCKSALIAINELHPNYATDINNFIAQDPMAALRQALDLRRFSYYLKDYCKRVILITLDMGGGTERHVNQLADEFHRVNIYPIIFKCREGKLFFDTSLLSIFPNLKSIDMDAQNGSLQNAMKILAIDFVHVHHLLGLKQETIGFLEECFALAQVPYYVTVHDYFPICPRINLIDFSGKYCGEPRVEVCDRCIKKSGSVVEIDSVTGWRRSWQRFLSGAERVIVPDRDVSERLIKYFKNINILVRPHETQAIVHRRTESKKIKKVVIIGAIGPHKGSDVLFSLASIAAKSKSKITFIVMGYTSCDSKFKKLKNVVVTGAYNDRDAVGKLKNLNCDAALFLSVWPETFSYTLSHALQAGIVPIVFDLGAQGRRVRELGVGVVLDPALMSKTNELLDRLERINILENFSCENFSGYSPHEKYYDAV